MEISLPALTTGSSVTVIFTSAESTQPPALVPTNVYLVVLAGLAVTLEPVLVESPEDGSQLYVEAPAAVRITAAPEQIVVSGPAVTCGNGLTITVTLDVSGQPTELTPVTV